MARSKTKKKGRGGPWLLEPATQEEEEVPALRARLIAAVAGGLAPIWRWLQDSSLGRLVIYYIPRRSVKLVPWAASHYVRGVDLAAENRGAIRIKPSLYPVKKQKHDKSQEEDEEEEEEEEEGEEEEAEEEGARADTWKPHVVDDVEVPLNQELLYEQYCKRALKNVQGRSFLCHMCIFEGQRTPNGIVPNGGMIIHCTICHNGSGIECEVEECQVRFKENERRELRLHQYFFHELPTGWWPKRR